MSAFNLNKIIPFFLGAFTGTLIASIFCIGFWSFDELIIVNQPDLVIPQSRLQPSDDTKVERTTGPGLYQPRDLVLYNILITDQNSMINQAAASCSSWGHDMKNLKVHAFYSINNEGQRFIKRNNIPLVIPSKKIQMKRRRNVQHDMDEMVSMMTIEQICDGYQHRYHWYVKMYGDTYVRTSLLERLLVQMDSSQHVYMGLPVVPNSYERDDLGMRPGENYCDSFAYVLSRTTMNLLCAHLEQCQKEARSIHEEVEISRCIRKFGKVNCTNAKDLFYKATTSFAIDELQVGNHELNPALDKAIFVSPLDRPDQMYHLHHYFLTMELYQTKQLVGSLRDSLMRATFIASPLNMTLTGSHSRTPSWARSGIRSPYRETSPSSVIHWQVANSTHLLTESHYRPTHPLNSVYKKDQQAVLNVSKQLLYKSLKQPSAIQLESVHYRVDPGRGIDYLLQVTVKERTNHHANREIVHVIREMEPARITAVSEALYRNTKVAFVVPAPPVSRSFQRFMMSFENSLLAHNPPEYVTLLIILYPNTATGPISKNVYTTVQLVDLYRKKYPQADLQILITQKPFSRLEAFALASKEFPTYELLFLADIHVDFSNQFLHRCRMNTIINQQMYFPAVYNPHDPGKFYKSRVLHPYATRFQINAKLGYWMQDSYHLACIYNEDLIKVLELSQDYPKLDLVDLVIFYGQLNIFRAADPGLVHLWQDGCKEYNLDQRGKALCHNIQKLA